MKQLENKPIYFIGDNHGQYDHMVSIVKSFDLRDCYLIHLGDGGEGFLPTDKQCRQFVYLNEFFSTRNVHYMSIRGNHSDPFYFQGESRIVHSNFELIEDYTVMEYNGKTIQFVGGAVSIDRAARTEGISYWIDEAFVLDENKAQKVDILITHTAPSWCYPQQVNSFVLEWARGDEYLLDDLVVERQYVDRLFEICQPTLHLYGHFHASWSEFVKGCKHKLLNCNEVWEYRSE